MRFIIRTILIMYCTIVIIVAITIQSSSFLDNQIITATLSDPRTTQSDVIILDIHTGISISLLHGIGEGAITGRTPIWSPDGRYVAFWTFANRRDTVAYEIELDTYQINNLTEDTIFFSLPIYGVDNQRLFASFPTFENVSIYLTDNLSQASDNILDNVYSPPAWSTDGRQIAYLAQFQPEEQVDGDNLDANLDEPLIDLYVLNRDTGETINYTSNSNRIGNPIWSPDGTQILFVSQSIDVGNLYRLDIASGEISEIPLAVTLLDLPVWSPDNRYIAFTASLRDNNINNTEVMILDMQTNELINLSDSPAFDNQPAWSPNGQHIAFVSNRTANNDEIYVMSLESRRIRRVTFTGENETDITWRP